MKAAHALRILSQEEEQALQRMVKATSERMDVVKPAKALLAVQAGKPYTEAALKAGYQSGDSISQLAEALQSARTGCAVDCAGTWPQRDLYT